MTKRKACAIGFILTLLPLLFLAITVQPVEANPKFIIASWNYPDEYGQGINLFHFYENSTGSWVETVTTPSHAYYANESYTMDWVVGGSIKLRCSMVINSTLTGAGSLLEGRNYLRHNVSVTDNTDAVVFSQDNFTYFNSGSVGDLYVYNYEVVLNFLPDYGQLYTVAVTGEVFYGSLALTGAVDINYPTEHDDTTDANDAGANDMPLLPIAPALNDAYCYAFDSPVFGIGVNVGTAGVKNDPPNAVITWQYSRGSNTWANLAGVTDGTNQYGIAGTHDVTWTVPTDWATDEVGGISGKYWVRSIVTTIGTSWLSAPLGTQAWQLSTWHLISEPSLVFITPLYTLSLDWLLIFLGLFMIPASTLYLVKGGKDGMSANKFFYFCIAFMLGWGLLLGGIMP